MQETLWKPQEEDKGMIKLMFDIGRTYSEYYFFNYGRDLGLMLERLSLTILKMGNGYHLDDNDKQNYLKLRDKLKHKIGEILNPRFLPGDLVSTSAGTPCTVMSKPYFDEISKKVVVDVLLDGGLVKFDSHKLRVAVRKKRDLSSKKSTSQP